MNTTMQHVIEHRDHRRRDDHAGVAWPEVLKLALLVSVLSVLASVALSTVAEVSTTVVVLAVIVVAFATSWIHTARHVA